MAKNIPYKIILPESEIPKQWYNIRADMKRKHDPLLNPQTFQPLTVEDLLPLFSRKLAEQELDSTTQYIDIPEEVYNYYKTFRPSPLIRAYNLEKELQTPARIYLKFEGNNTSGSHKLNSAIAQVYYAKEEGIKHISTETGAGQWGTALSMACCFFKIPLTVYMVRGSYEQKPFRKNVMQTFGAKVIPSPSNTTKVGQEILKKFPHTPGSLGCAISEAVEQAILNQDTKYCLGSVLDLVVLHQSVIGLEAKAALDLYGEYPDIIIGCTGGGSNLGGLICSYMKDKLEGKKNPYFIAVEPVCCPSLTRGKFVYDYCDTGKVTPLAKMYTVGCEFQPSPDHAGGLRFHGLSPILSQLFYDKYLDEARAIEQTKIFESAVLFSRVEGIVPAPESAHAIHVGIEEALKCKETGESKVILIGFSGTGSFDMTAYAQFKEKSMSDYPLTDEDLQRSFSQLPKIPGIQE